MWVCLHRFFCSLLTIVFFIGFDIYIVPAPALYPESYIWFEVFLWFELAPHIHLFHIIFLWRHFYLCWLPYRIYLIDWFAYQTTLFKYPFCGSAGKNGAMRLIDWSGRPLCHHEDYVSVRNGSSLLALGFYGWKPPSTFLLNGHLGFFWDSSCST